MANDEKRRHVNNRYKVVIIGAGISAFGAANQLCSEGIDDIAILEATDRIGGRIWSIDLDSNMGHKVELGANWIHGIELNPIFKIAKQHNLLSNQYAGRHLGKKMLFVTETGVPVNGRIVESVDMDYGMLMSECDEFYQQQQPAPDDCESVGLYIEQMFEHRIEKFSPEEKKLRRSLLQHHMLGECIISGANSLHDVSLSDCGSFDELPGVHYVIPPGFEKVVHILAQNVPAQAVHLNHVVTKVSFSDKKNPDIKDDTEDYPICIECANGKKFYAEICLVTISLGYLKQHAGRLFSPPLPENKVEAIHRVAMGTVNKIILEFDDQVLPTGVFRLQMVWTTELEENADISETWIRKVPSFEAVADNVLMGWLSGEEAEYVEMLTDEEVGRRCVETLNAFLGKTKSVPNLKKVTRSSWKSNSFTLGSYCHIPVGGSVEDIKVLSEPVNDRSGKPIILFAGEATHPTFYSSSHGALLSGQREAERIIELLH